jgi:hypothetical protein
VSSGREALALASVRDGGEFYLSLVSAPCLLALLFLSCSTLGPFSCGFPFSFRLLRAVSSRAQSSVSVYIRPVCITPFFSRVSFLSNLDST